MLKEKFQTKQALGGDVTIVLVGQEQINFEQIFNKLWAEIFKFESKFSRFLPNSELTEFNSKAGLSVAVSDEFEKILHEF